MSARALMLMVALVACGRTGPVVAPELVHPKPPADVFATAMPDGVQLRWARPSQYTSGKRMRDLGSFIIERATDTGTTLEFTEIGTVTLEDRYRFQQDRRVEWLDTSATDGQRYAYRVVAVTLDDYHSEPAGPVSIDFRRPTAKPTPPPKPKSNTPSLLPLPPPPP